MARQRRAARMPNCHGGGRRDQKETGGGGQTSPHTVRFHRAAYHTATCGQFWSSPDWESKQIANRPITTDQSHRQISGAIRRLLRRLYLSNATTVDAGNRPGLDRRDTQCGRPARRAIGQRCRNWTWSKSESRQFAEPNRRLCLPHSTAPAAGWLASACVRLRPAWNQRPRMATRGTQRYFTTTRTTCAPSNVFVFARCG